MAADDDEPRVRDLLRKPEAEGSVSDPALVAQLAAWFDLPSFASLDDAARAAAVPAAEPDPHAEAREQVKRRRAEATANVDPAMVLLLERHAIAAARLVRPVPPPRPWEDPARVLAFDEASVPPLPDPDEQPDVPIPPQLIKDLKTCTPQAFLRDLHRPEKEFYVTLQPPFVDDEDPPPPDPMAPVRETLRRDYRVGTTIAPAAATMATSWADLRARLAIPWAEGKRERARRREEELLRKEAEAAGVARGPEAPR